MSVAFLGILIFIIGFSMIEINQEPNYQKNWIGAVGYVVCMLGAAVCASAF